MAKLLAGGGSSASNAEYGIATSQLALPQDVCEEVYASTGYETSKRNLANTSLQLDMVFRDGWITQLGPVTGDSSSGMTVTLNVPVWTVVGLCLSQRFRELLYLQDLSYPN